MNMLWNFDVAVSTTSITAPYRHPQASHTAIASISTSNHPFPPLTGHSAISQGTCIVFRSWHIKSNFDLILSCLVLILISISYEYLRMQARLLDRRIEKDLVSSRTRDGGRSPGEESTILQLQQAPGSVKVPVLAQVIRSSFYAGTVGISAMLMLVFMTYNAALISAVVIGAGIGHFVVSGLVCSCSLLYEVADTLYPNG